jgi:hypothetical protein
MANVKVRARNMRTVMAVSIGEKGCNEFVRKIRWN